ncbi:MAG: hypothetical protein HFG00_05135 [Oscillibacter sp.]|nr:hypothetical protein [Oscillibacter sp.]
MEEIHYEAVKALVEQWDYDWGCGPFEDCLPEEDELRKLNDWTGRSWTAEDVRLACFEYASHNSLEETIYFLFHGAYPPVTNTELVFYRSRPGAVLDPKTVYETYRLGKQMKALVPLPVEEITEALRAVPGFQEDPQKGFAPGLLMNGLEQPAYWSNVCFYAFWYGGRGNPRPDHLLCLSCRNLSGPQIQTLTGLLADFALPVQYREADHIY